MWSLLITVVYVNGGVCMHQIDNISDEHSLKRIQDTHRKGLQETDLTLCASYVSWTNMK